MNKSKIGTTIIEAVIVTLIVVVGVVGVLNIFTNSLKLTTSSKNRLVAISMAREGIEGVTNIRDTNWLNFQSNLEDCWNTLNYNANCIVGTDTKIPEGSYTIFNGDDNRWYLSGVTAGTGYSENSYKNSYEVKLDSLGFYTQSGGVKSITPLFTREIKISYLPSTPAKQKMKVSSLVQWVDSSSKNVQKVLLETVLTNWKTK